MSETQTPVRPCQRIGRHWYAPESTRERLLLYAAETGERVARFLQQDNDECAKNSAYYGAAAALDATDPGRAYGPLVSHWMWTSGSKLPKPGDIIFNVPEWGWRVTIAGTLYDRHTASEELMARQYSVRMTEDRIHPVRPPRILTFGFWGTWNPSQGIEREKAWELIFEMYGSGGADDEADCLLRDALDHQAGRHYADSCCHADKTEPEFRDAIRKLGDPRKCRARYDEPSRWFGKPVNDDNDPKSDADLRSAVKALEEACTTFLNNLHRKDPDEANPARVKLLASGLTLWRDFGNEIHLMIDQDHSDAPTAVVLSSGGQLQIERGGRTIPMSVPGDSAIAAERRRCVQLMRRIGTWGGPNELPGPETTPARHYWIAATDFQMAINALRRAANDEGRFIDRIANLADELHEARCRLIVGTTPQGQTGSLELRVQGLSGWHVNTKGEMVSSYDGPTAVTSAMANPGKNDSSQPAAGTHDACAKLIAAIDRERRRSNLLKDLESSLAALLQHPDWNTTDQTD